MSLYDTMTMLLHYNEQDPNVTTVERPARDSLAKAENMPS